MIDPGWAIRTPDANDLLFKSGPGVATMLAALAAYLAEMAVTETAAGISTANMVGLNAGFQGATNVSSTATVTSINAAAHLAFGWLAEKPPIITTAVDAYTMAYSAMIPAALCQLNRDEWAMFNALNSILPGAFLPPMLDRDREYFGHFWPNNSTTGATYSAVLTGLMPALAIPPPITPPGASPDLPATAATAVAQTTAAGTAGDAMRTTFDAAGQFVPGGQTGTGQLTDLAQKALQPVQGVVEMVPKALESVMGLPEKAFQPVTSVVQSLTGMMGGAFKPDSLAAAESVRPTGISAPPTNLGPTAGVNGVGPGGVPGAAPAVTQYTRPVSGFHQDQGGRPTGLRAATLLNATDVRGPTTGGPGGGIPMSPAGMLARHQGDGEQQTVTRARIVIEGERTDRD